MRDCACCQRARDSDQVFMRNGSLDLARLLAAFGVVLFHVHAPGDLIGYAGLTYFLILVPAFGLASSTAHSFTDFIASRARRLLLPWILWSVIFAAFRLAWWPLAGRPPEQIFDLSMIATGPALHLWFLPYAFLASLFLPAIRQFAVGLNRPALRLLLSATLVAPLAGFWPDLPRAADPPWAQWEYGLPGLLVGLALGLAWLRGEDARRVSVGALGVAGLAWLMGWQDGALQLVIAVGAVLACLVFPVSPSPLTAFCTRHSMGVYLVHPLCQSALERIVPLDHHGLAMALLVMAASLGLSILLGMRRGTRVLIDGFN